MESEKIELKNCPFCGGEPENFEDKWMYYFWVGCKKDDCPATAAGVKMPERAEAIRKWNARDESNQNNQLRTLFLWKAGELSEGQAMKRLNLDRVSLRVLREQYLNSTE